MRCAAHWAWRRHGAGVALGAWAGFGIWLSPETMPFSLMAFGGLWLAWLAAPQGRDIARMIRATGVAFLLVVAGALAVDPPYAGYAAAEIDRISKVYLLLAFAICMTGCAGVEIDRLALRRWSRIAAWLAVPAIYLGVWIGLFPTVVRGPDGLMSAAETHAFLDGISEMMPVQGAGEAVEFLLTGVAAALLLAWLGATRRSLLLGYAAICGCILVVTRRDACPLRRLYCRGSLGDVADADLALLHLAQRSDGSRPGDRPRRTDGGIRAAAARRRPAALVVRRCRHKRGRLLPVPCPEALRCWRSMRARWCWPIRAIPRSCCIARMC